MSGGFERGKILLILPCTSTKPYSSSPTWRYIIKRIEPWRDCIDLAAIDCITNPVTGKPFGIVPASKEDLVIGLDEKPNSKKLGPLVESVKVGLTCIRHRFQTIIAYINVKTYWQALEGIAEEFGICLMPSIYRNASSWSADSVGASPPGVFRKYINELVDEISRIEHTR